MVWRVEAGLERPACPGCGFIHYEDPKLVAIAVIPVDGRLVFGRRTMNPGIGLWAFPGGFVNRGESVQGALVREVREETNLDVSAEYLLGLYSEEDNPIVLAAYVARPIGGQLGVGEEVSEVGLFEPNGLPELAFPHDRTILGEWVRYEVTLKTVAQRPAILSREAESRGR
jgi:ADP-ribose pyrophosphatase YjhB (NUDIX family)